MISVTLLAPALKWFGGAGMGIGAGWVSEVLKGRQSDRDQKHERKLLKLEIEYSVKAAPRLQADRELSGRMELAEDRLAYQGAAKTGIKIVDLANGLMRPAAAAACIVGFVLFSGLLLGSMTHDLWLGHIDYEHALAAFQDSVIADTIVVVWGFLFGARSFRAGRS